MQREDLWQGIVARHDLAPNTLKQIVGESHHYADLCFAVGANDAPPPIFVSTVRFIRPVLIRLIIARRAFVIGCRVCALAASFPRRVPV
jgi:hypothetical protein